MAQSVPVLVGEDKAYALWRLAEIHADLLHQPDEARLWCRRFLGQIPDSPLAAQVLTLRDSLGPAAPSA